MTNSYRHLGQQTAKPIVGSLEDNFGREEVDMSGSLEEEMNRLHQDENAYVNLLINQYNHIHSNFSQWPEQFQGLLGKSVSTLDEYQKYQKATKPIIDIHNRMKKVKDVGIKLVAEQPGIEKNPFKEEIIQGVEEGDDSKISLLDSDIAEYELNKRNEDNVKNESEIYKKGANEAGILDAARAAHEGPVGGNGVPLEIANEQFYSSTEQLLKLFEGSYYDAATAGLTIQVGNHPDGTPVYKTFHNTESAAEAILMSDVIATHFIQKHRNLSMGNFGRWKKEFLVEVFKIAEEKLLTKLQNIGDAQKTHWAKQRALELKNRLGVDKGYLPRHILRYRGAHDGDIRSSKREAVGYLKNLIKTNVFDRDEVDQIIDSKFIARDPNIGETSIREYWPDERDEILAALGESETVQRETDLADREAKSKEYVHNAKMESINRKEPYSLDEKHKIIQGYMSTFKVGMEEVPDDLKSLYTVATVPDQDILYHLAAKNHKNPGSVSMKDLEGIQDYETKKKAIEDYLTDKGVDADVRDSFIIGEVEVKTGNTLGDAGRGREWRAYQYNATNAFNEAYQKTRDAGGDHGDGMTAGIEAVQKGLFGKEAGTKWSRWPGPTYSDNDSRQLGLIQQRIGKDPIGMLNSETPWEGEIPHIRAALNYANNNTGTIPEFYKQFTFIKRLPDGRVNFPERFMMYRLKKLGLLKNDKPLPEDKLPDYLQVKLQKPNPSKTLQVISEPEGLSLLPEFVINSNGEEVSTVQVLRNQASINQQYNTLIAGNHTKQVNLPEELTTRFTGISGELPSHLHIDNLAPAVAKAFAEDILTA